MLQRRLFDRSTVLPVLGALVFAAWASVAPADERRVSLTAAELADSRGSNQGYSLNGSKTCASFQGYAPCNAHNAACTTCRGGGYVGGNPFGGGGYDSGSVGGVICGPILVGTCNNAGQCALTAPAGGNCQPAPGQPPIQQ